MLQQLIFCVIAEPKIAYHHVREIAGNTCPFVTSTLIVSYFIHAMWTHEEEKMRCTDGRLTNQLNTRYCLNININNEQRLFQ